jgi:hypothetical protein
MAIITLTISRCALSSATFIYAPFSPNAVPPLSLPRISCLPSALMTLLPSTTSTTTVRSLIILFSKIIKFRTDLSDRCLATSRRRSSLIFDDVHLLDRYDAHHIRDRSYHFRNLSRANLPRSRHIQLHDGDGDGSGGRGALQPHLARQPVFARQRSLANQQETRRIVHPPSAQRVHPLPILLYPQPASSG